MKIVLQTNGRMGEIVRIFPLALHLHRQKHEVFIECRAEYRSILGLIDYATWQDPKAGPMMQLDRDLYIPASIDGRQVYDFRHEQEPARWLEFIARRAELLKGHKREIVFTRLPELDPILEKYRLAKVYSLACANGATESASVPIDFSMFEHWMCGQKPRGLCYLLCTPGFRPNRNFLCVDDLAELAALIRGAADFYTILAGPAVIACGTFEKEPLRKSWHHVSPGNPLERFQDDVTAKGQVRWELDFSGPQYRIVRQKMA